MSEDQVTQAGVMDDHRLSLLQVPGPTPTAESVAFWDGARQGRLCIPKCENCGRFFFYPRHLCPHCWSRDWAWQRATGAATLKTLTTVHRAGHPGWAAVAPYSVGLVELDEGPTLLTHLLDLPADYEIGMAMTVQFVRVGEWVLPCFAPRETVQTERENS